MVKRILFALMFMAVAVAAEKEKPAESAAEVASKVFVLKHVKPDQFIGYFTNFGVKVLALPGTQALAVSGPPQVVRAIEEYVKLIDVPRTAIRNIELIGYLLMVTQKPLAQANVPPVLEPVVKQLKSLFAYEGFTLIQTVAIRGREGESGSTNGIMGWPLDEKLPPGNYSFQYQRLGVSPDPKGTLVRLERLQFHARVPQTLTAEQRQAFGPGVQFQDVRLNTDVDIRDGQKVVIGKANTDAAGSALVLILTAKVME